MISTLRRFVRKKLLPRLSPETLRTLHRAESALTAARLGFPARGMLVLGVTGTKGKTTTSHFVSAILREAGYKVGMITTATFQIGDEVTLNEQHMTALPAKEMNLFIKRAKEAGCDALIIETSSHALDQERVWGVPYKYVGLTNITHDHLDYHKTWDAYQKAKLRLFKRRGLRAAVVNGRDSSAELFLAETTAPRKWSYTLEEAEPTPGTTDHLIAHHVSGNGSQANFIISYNGEEQRVQLNLPGRFSVENALCAAALCLNLNLKLGTVVAGLQSVTTVPGRLEKIETRKGFSVLVDYAHTPDSLEQLYSTLRPDVRGRMIAVLGSTGDRDKTKRPIMGALAARFCDYVLVTDEEPYSENPQTIIDEVAAGVPRGRPLFKPNKPNRDTEKPPVLRKPGTEQGEGDWWWRIADRKEAITKAIEMAKMDDVILVTGMGAQTTRFTNAGKEPWKEREIIETILREKKLL